MCTRIEKNPEPRLLIKVYDVILEAKKAFVDEMNEYSGVNFVPVDSAKEKGIGITLAG